MRQPFSSCQKILFVEAKAVGSSTLERQCNGTIVRILEKIEALRYKGCFKLFERVEDESRCSSHGRSLGDEEVVEQMIVGFLKPTKTWKISMS